ncbi:MAG: nuclear transport factor 2 family protein [Bacteroidales bacterium]|nr:nuclear transport factor 2 family protein [Bacteroidales bacterium]MCF6341383.1 nuclear transport factor 2 family protein [Bacteroidales bacterium]
MKKTNALLVVFVFLLLSSCGDCEKKINKVDEIGAIETLLEEYVIANENQDFDLIEKIWAPDSDIILYGTDSDERLMGWTNIRNAVREQFQQIDETYISASDQFIKLNCTGTTAWFAETLDYNFVYKDEAKSFKGLRFTGVVEKIDGQWKLVQAHLSLPANVDIGK